MTRRHQETVAVSVVKKLSPLKRPALAAVEDRSTIHSMGGVARCHVDHREGLTDTSRRLAVRKRAPGRPLALWVAAGSCSSADGTALRAATATDASLCEPADCRQGGPDHFGRLSRRSTCGVERALGRAGDPARGGRASGVDSVPRRRRQRLVVELPNSAPPTRSRRCVVRVAGLIASVDASCRRRARERADAADGDRRTNQQADHAAGPATACNQPREVDAGRGAADRLRRRCRSPKPSSRESEPPSRPPTSSRRPTAPDRSSPRAPEPLIAVGTPEVPVVGPSARREQSWRRASRASSPAFVEACAGRRIRRRR